MGNASARSIRATPSSIGRIGARRRWRSRGYVLPGAVKAQVPDCPLYWFLIVKGHRTYRYLSAFSVDFYPHWQMPTPAWAQSIMAALARRRFNDAYDASAAWCRFRRSRGHLRPTWAAVEPEEAARPDVAFFLDSNPGYVRGDELVCLTELSSANLRPLARRVFGQGLRNRVATTRLAPMSGWGSILAAARAENEAFERACGGFARLAVDVVGQILQENARNRIRPRAWVRRHHLL